MDPTQLCYLEIIIWIFIIYVLSWVKLKWNYWRIIRSVIIKILPQEEITLNYETFTKINLNPSKILLRPRLKLTWAVNFILRSPLPALPRQKCQENPSVCLKNDMEAGSIVSWEFPWVFLYMCLSSCSI